MAQCVVVGLSGGVDSSVAAWLLKQQGYEVAGLFMINWHDTEGTLSGSCPWEEDLLLARMVARRLQIPLHTVDLSQTYRQRVVDYMFAEYARGRTPNPDVLCNREIKFDVFLKEALKLGADYVATGHYCRKLVSGTEKNPVYHLLAGKDNNKDQSYFLCQLSQEQLSRALFPIGDMVKPEVRRIADEQQLATATRKDSQGICFVGKVNLPVFLQQQLKPKKGNIVEIDAGFAGFGCPEPSGDETDRLRALAAPYVYTPEDGTVIGTHQGAHYYTIGQRKGLHAGGHREPVFVLATDTVTNTVYVGEGYRHPGLFRRGLFIPQTDVHWVNPSRQTAEGENRRCAVRIRYRQPLQQAVLHHRPDGMYIVFDTPQRGITPGQFAAWYEGEELTGSGVIA